MSVAHSLLLLVLHVISSEMILLQIIQKGALSVILARSLCFIAVIHIILSMSIMFFNLDKNASSPFYILKNKTTATQRWTAIVFLFALFVHITAQLCTMPLVIMIIAELVMLIIGGLHFSVSVSRGFVTLGLLGSEKSFKTVNIIVLIIYFLLIAGYFTAVALNI